MKNVKRLPLPSHLKKVIMYEQNYQCAICFQVLPPSYQFDHIVPLWRFKIDPLLKGCDPNQRSNIQCLCGNCHLIKSGEEDMMMRGSEKPPEVTIKSPYF